MSSKNQGNAFIASAESIRLNREASFIKQLGNPQSIYAGDTTFAIRQERIRDHILNAIASTRRRESWAKIYLEFYGEDVTAQPKGKTQ